MGDGRKSVLVNPMDRILPRHSTRGLGGNGKKPVAPLGKHQ